jgi:hypothetical protein
METRGLKRSGLEQFYTAPDIAELCVRETIDTLPIREYTLVIEPSAGQGIFIDVYKKHDMRPWVCIKGLDIDPKRSDIVKQDYLNTVIQRPDKGKVLVLGNPPFGRNSSLAKKFIRKSCTYTDTIAFILPKSFRKPSFERAFDTLFHKVSEIELPKNSFILNDKPYDVPCVFQIWNKQGTHRVIPAILEPDKEYSFNTVNANTAFKRVGVKAGTFVFDTEIVSSLSKQSHYFLVLPQCYIDVIKESPPVFETANDTTGPKSVSKQVLIEYLNHLKKE